MLQLFNYLVHYAEEIVPVEESSQKYQVFGPEDHLDHSDETIVQKIAGFFDQSVDHQRVQNIVVNNRGEEVSLVCVFGAFGKRVLEWVKMVLSAARVFSFGFWLYDKIFESGPSKFGI